METVWRVEVSVLNATGIGHPSLSIGETTTDILVTDITEADKVRLREICDVAHGQLLHWLSIRKPKGSDQ